MRQPRKNAPFPLRLACAWRGIAAAYRRESSFRSQVWLAGVVVAILAVLRPGWGWSALVLAVIGLVLVAELFNTALETLLDGLHPQQAEFVRLAKDCAAGAALVASLTAAGVGAAMLVDWAA